MYYQNINFHNIEFIKKDKKKNEIKLCRVAQQELLFLNEKAQQTAFNTCGVELRFKMKSDIVKIKLNRYNLKENISQSGIVSVYLGDYQCSYEVSPQIISKNSTITLPKKYFYDNLLKNYGKGFSSDLIRVILPYDWQHSFLGIEGDIELPSTKDYPEKLLLAYGSSITHGGNATQTTDSYVFKLAKKLYYDYLNWGFAGSCYLDEVMAKKIRDASWDTLILELGVNVLDWPDEYFQNKVKTFLEIVSQTKNTGKIYCLGLFRKVSDLSDTPKNNVFRKIVKEESEKYSQMIYLNGYDLLSDWQGLSLDGLHPSDFGMELIAENIYKEIQRNE